MSVRRRLAAARWAERAADGSTDARFRRWIADASNAEALAKTSAVRERVRALADDPGLADLRADTNDRLALPRDATTPTWWMAAAAALVAAVALPTFLLSGGATVPAAVAPAPIVYRTAIGQRLELALPDRSRLVLDTASQVRVAYDGAERRLHLDRGQALFEVAHGDKRPFVVAAAGREVVAHGTRFDVRLRSGDVHVALVEGSVSVAAQGTKAVRMRPDELLVADRSGMRVARDPAAVAAFTSWREGLLVFRDRTVAEAAAEMNRYAAPPIVLGDAAVAGVRISGSFRTGETRAFVDALQLGFPIRATQRTDGAVVLTRR
jgi:transmembrane sensor